MFIKSISLLILSFIFKEFKISAVPIEILIPDLLHLQVLNNTALLAYQGLDLKEMEFKGNERKKRCLDEILNMLLEEFYDEDDEEDDSSSKEDSSEENVTKKNFDLCRNCSVTFNHVDQQNIYENSIPTKPTTSHIPVTDHMPTSEPATTTEQTVKSSTPDESSTTTTIKPEGNSATTTTTTQKLAESVTESTDERINEITTKQMETTTSGTQGEQEAQKEPENTNGEINEE
ncbi:uncharacterized protein ACRADG_012834 [Cochliomyia hominivorax]